MLNERGLPQGARRRLPRPARVLGAAVAVSVLAIGFTAPWSGAQAAAPFAYRASAGGWSSVSGPDGVVFSADRDYQGGSAAGPFSGDVAGTTADDLYRKHRWGMTGYSVAVPASATYKVRLHFAEPVFSTAGRRVFHVTAEGSQKVSNLDVVAQAGRFTALVVEFNQTVKDGRLDLGFTSVVEDPFISGIEVLSTGRPTPTTAAPTPVPTTVAPTTTTVAPTTTTVAPTPTTVAPTTTTVKPTTTTTVAPTTTTTVPPSGGTGGSRCPAYPAFPDASCTGVLPGSSLSPSGSVTTSFDGQVIQNLDISGSIQVNHNNVTVRNVRLRNPGGTAITVLQKTGLVVEDCEIDGTGNTNGAEVINHHNYTIRRCNVHHFGEGPRANGNVVIEDNYFHSFTNFIPQGAHQDCVQITSGNNITIRHNTCLMNVDGGNAAIMIGSYSGGDILVENNLLGGGGFTAYCGEMNGYTNVRYLNNRFSTAYFPRGGYWGPWAQCGNATRTGNVWHDGPNAGQPVS